MIVNFEIFTSYTELMLAGVLDLDVPVEVGHILSFFDGNLTLEVVQTQTNHVIVDGQGVALRFALLDGRGMLAGDRKLLLDADFHEVPRNVSALKT